MNNQYLAKNLTITFKRGAQYVYKNVSASDYMRFETAESQGAILNSHIKQYPVDKGDTIDANLIVEEIDKLKAENQQLKVKIQQLESMLMSTSEALHLKVTPEEQICVKQIDSLNRISNERDLTLEEVKKLDFLVKNLKMYILDMNRTNKLGL